MQNQIFRKKNMDRISSPEQLNQYIRVSNPGVWILLGAIAILLIGILVWGKYGTLDSLHDTVAICENGVATLYIKEKEISSVKKGMAVYIDKGEYVIEDISVSPVYLDKSFDRYALHVGMFTEGEWAYEAKVQAEDVNNGIYAAEVVVDQVSPLSFIFN